MLKKAVIAIVVCLFVAASVYAQERGLPTQAKALVEQAVAYVKANGEDQAIKEFNNPKGQFVKGDLYIFVYNPKGICLANPLFPNIIGKDLYNSKDSKGKQFRKEIVDLANSKGLGWVDYMYWNPQASKEEVKVVYFQKVGNLIVCCGAYLP